MIHSGFRFFGAIFQCADRFFTVQSVFSMCRAIFPCAEQLFCVQGRILSVQSDFSLCRAVFLCAKENFVCAERFFSVRRVLRKNYQTIFLMNYPAIILKIFSNFFDFERIINSKKRF